MGWGKGQRKEHTYLQQNGGVPLDHPRKCIAHKHTGEPCRRYAIRGGTVCPVHGGTAPQVRRKAAQRLNKLEDQAMMRAIMRRRRGDYQDPPVPAAIDPPADLTPATTPPIPATEIPADTPPQDAADDLTPPTTPTDPGTVSASPTPPVEPPVKPLMGLGEAMAEGRRPPRPMTRRRR